MDQAAFEMGGPACQGGEAPANFKKSL